MGPVLKSAFLPSLLFVVCCGSVSGFAQIESKEPPFPGVSLSVDSPTVPPGGLLQVQVFITEPKPILKGKQGLRSSRAAVANAAPPLGPVRDAALFSTTGDVTGVAVTGASGTQFFFSSPLDTFGMSVDTPVMTIAYPVSATAAVGQVEDLNLDPDASLWLDPNGKQYPVELKSGKMTVGGSLSISDVTPGSGTATPTTVISIKGTGFEPNSKVDFGEGKVETQEFINSNLIKVTLRDSIKIRGQRIRVENSGNEKATYFPYGRTTQSGTSKHALVAACIPLFPQAAISLGYFRPSLRGTIFSGLALQNLTGAPVTATLQLHSNSGVLLSEQTISLGKSTRIARDLAELFPGVTAATGTKLSVTSTKPIQMLGLLGDDSTGTLLPVAASKTP
jgi:hypothetical protein